MIMRIVIIKLLIIVINKLLRIVIVKLLIIVLISGPYPVVFGLVVRSFSLWSFQSSKCWSPCFPDMHYPSTLGQYTQPHRLHKKQNSFQRTQPTAYTHAYVCART